MTLLEFLDQFSPRACRVVARKANGKRPLSHAEIAAKAGISKAYVFKLSTMDSWAGVGIAIASAYAQACGVDLLHPREQITYIRESKMAHLRASSRADRRTDQSQAKLFRRVLRGGN